MTNWERIVINPYDYVSPVLSKNFIKMKIDVYKLLPDKVKDYIAEEISEALAKNNIDNSAVSWDINCDVLDINEDL